jgi:hypothetical protein
MPADEWPAAVIVTRGGMLDLRTKDGRLVRFRVRRGEIHPVYARIVPGRSARGLECLLESGCIVSTQRPTGRR